jgi:hypothetical protein
MELVLKLFTTVIGSVDPTRAATAGRPSAAPDVEWGPDRRGLGTPKRTDSDSLRPRSWSQKRCPRIVLGRGFSAAHRTRTRRSSVEADLATTSLAVPDALLTNVHRVLSSDVKNSEVEAG